MIKKGLAGVVVAVVFGILSSRYLLVGSALSLIPWGIAGVLLGVWCAQYREAAGLGALYGFLIAFTFMVTGYQGAAPILSRVPFFAILGLVGAVCGVGLGVIGAFLRSKL
jgi:hypothetical protein